MSNFTFVNEIDIEKKEISSDEHLCEDFMFFCRFCSKKIKSTSKYNNINKVLVRSNSYYCPFCIRNQFYTKRKKHILQLSFRGIIGYLYWKYYRAKDKKLYLNEIKDMISDHEKVGLQNPAFNYDPDTLIWFVDFSLVGPNKRQLDIEEINRTIVNILACFNLSEIITIPMNHKLFEKYKEAIDLFYQKRQRPENKRLLVPTFAGCGGVMATQFDYENKCRKFLPDQLVSR